MKLRKQISLRTIVVLALYNIIAFLIPAVKNTTFWVAYAFSNLSILISGLVILGALDKEGIKNKFQSMPMVYISLTYTTIQLVTVFFEIYYPINFRYSILINIVILGLSIIGFSIIGAGKKEIEKVEEKVQEKVFFIKELQTEIEIFVDKIKDEQTKKELNLLAETIKYSDPMSHSQLATIENQINTKVQKITQITDDNELIKETCKEIQQLLAERNKKAKIYKGQPEQDKEPQKPLNFKLIIAVIITILVLIGIAVTLYFTIILPNEQYNNAMKLYSNKQYIQAKSEFEKLGDYKDSQEKNKEITYEYATELFDKHDYDNAEKEFEVLGDYKDSKDKKNEIIYQNATNLYSNKEYSKAAEKFLLLDNYKDSKDKVMEIYNLFGDQDVVYFGEYKGKPIEWQILDTREHKVLLITKQCIDEMAYNTEYKAIEWKDSSIRKWLNEDFYNGFDEKEKSKILKNTEETDDIFLLSYENIKSYKKLKNTNTSWWLETSGDETTKAMYASENGTINTSGDTVTKLHGIRPSIWLTID